MKDQSFAVFGGFGEQCWTSPGHPDIYGKCDGLTVCRMDPETGEMVQVSQSHGVESPSTLVVSPDKKYIYAANESHDFQGTGYGGGVTAFSFDRKTGKTEVINQSLSYGSSACYITIDKTGKYLLVACHGGRFYVTRFKEVDGALVPDVQRDEGLVSLFAIRPDGGVGKLLDRLVLQGTGGDAVIHGSAHPHSVQIDDDDFVIIPNKGGDNIYVAKLDREAGKLETLSVYPTGHGSSPRHACFAKGTPYVLVQNEYDAHLCSYRLDKANGRLTLVSRVDTVDRQQSYAITSIGKQIEVWGLDVQIHPNGRFVYTNSTVGTVCVSHLDPETGNLTVAGRFVLDVSSMPRGIQIDPTGRFLAVTGVQNEKVILLRIDQETGLLTAASEVAAPTPTAARFIGP